MIVGWMEVMPPILTHRTGTRPHPAATSQADVPGNDEEGGAVSGIALLDS
ncbi:hypothetical protein HMPREF0321_1442 [Dermacoccus sp. Ellin185]|nr:hypothetical protein HMPREF0321_1442 [Dermacoccus sp. Ellin185]